jgi:hypothetical protein
MKSTPRDPQPRFRCAALAAAGMLTACPAAAGITIEHVAFHDATHSTAYSESGAVDDGGVVFVFVRNTGTVTETVTGLTVNGTSVNSLANFRWWRVWPKTIAPGGIATVFAKVNSAPLNEGASVSISVQAQSGAAANAGTTLATPALRIGSVIPSQDRRTVHVLLRNLDTAAHAIQQVWLNDDVTAQCTFVGGATVGANRVGIVKVAFAQPQPLLRSFVVRIVAARAGGGTTTVAAPIRLIEPIFPLGHWYSTQFDTAAKLQFARRNHLEMAAGVPNSGSAMNNGAQNYHIRSVPFAFTSGSNAPDPSQIAPNIGNPNLLAWFVRDEPDINSISSADIAAWTETFQTLDPTHPVYVNLASNRRSAEYGHITDIVGEDHYSAFNAPNIIPGTWVTRKAQLEETLEWADVLKRNTEPKLMWNWPQGVAVGTWGTQPRDWAIDVQFWMNVMGGSKGLFWFLNREEHLAGHESKFDAMQRCARRLAQVRNLLLYGETMDHVTLTPGARIKARAIISEDAVVVPVINLDYAVGGLAFSPSYSINAESAEVTVPVPSWLLPVAQVYEVVAEGRLPVTFTASGNSVSFSVALGNSYTSCSRVYVIGRPDTKPPEAPSRLNLAEIKTGNACVLSWREPWDDFGVQGYKVYRNGQEIADVKEPIHTTSAIADADLAGTQFAVRAYDSAGNLGPLSTTLQYATWQFTEDGSFGGWRSFNQMNNRVVSGGRLSFDLGGSDPHCFVDAAGLKGALFPKLVVRMRNQTSGTEAKFRWGTVTDPAVNDTRAVTIPIVPNSGLTSYAVNLSAHSGWNGQTMTELKFDPVNNAGSGRIEIDFISLNNLPANTAPSFARGADVTVNEDAPPQTRAAWATAISPGPPTEASQQVSFVLSGITAALYGQLPQISPSGTLTFIPAANASGTNTITVTAEDDAADWLGGGTHRSTAQTLRITVNSVNDAPVFTAGPNQTAARGTDAQTINGWATGISPGAPNESAQALTFLVTATPANLFEEQPAIAADGRLTFRPGKVHAGTAVVTVQLRDNGGTANGGQDASAPQTFSIEITRPPLPENPRLELISPPGASPLELSLPGTTGLIYDLETSIDLLTWETAATQPGSDATIVFRYTPSGDPPRFFRARIR